MVREIGFNLRLRQRLLKWHLIPPCLTLSNIRYVSRVKLSNPGKGVAPSSTPWCSSYWKRRFRVALDNARQLYFTYSINSVYIASKDFSFQWWILKDSKKWRCPRRYNQQANYSIIENGQNTKKSPGYLGRLAVTQNHVKDHQLKLMWKTLMTK